MSRIDYITIAIVAVCLGGLAYLLVNVARINQPVPAGNDSTAKVDTLQPDQFEEASLDSLVAASVDTVSVPLTQKKETATEAEGEKSFLVVAASFNTDELAQEELQRLTQLGYQDCEIGYFNRRQIVSVIAGRFTTYEQAEHLAEEMKQKHKVDAYVHQKRSQ